MTSLDSTRPDDWRADDAQAARPVAPTPEMRHCLRIAFRTALIRLATDLGLVLLIALIALWAGNYLFIAVALVFGAAIGTPSGAVQAYRLRRSLDRPGILRLFGPLRLTEHRRNGISSYTTFFWAELANGSRVHVDEGLYAALAAAGEQLPDRRPLFRKLLGGQSVYQLPTVVATYSATGRLLLEVRTPGGETVARQASYTADDT